MPINPSGYVDIPLDVFGGLNTEIAPVDVPEGVSPDCEDVAFLPGSVLSRPALSKLWDTPLSSLVTVMWAKTYVQPNGVPINLYLDSLGRLWRMDPFSAPQTKTQIGTVSAGSYASSVTAFGREYICFHDGQKGTDIPLHYDGTNLDRVSQDGPGEGPTIAGSSASASTIASTGAGGVLTISTAASSDSQSYTYQEWDYTGYPPTYREVTITYYLTFTVNTTTAHGLSGGETVVISGATNFNGTWRVGTIVDADTFKVSYNHQPSKSTAAGSVQVPGSTLVLDDNVVTAVTTTDHNLQVGFKFEIGGVTNTNIGGGISAAARVSNVATITTTAAHGLSPGAYVAITGVTDATFNIARVRIETVPSPTTFTYTSTGTDGTSSSGNVQFIWNGAFYVSSVVSATSFTYKQLGPNGYATVAGTVTPTPQIAAGNRSCVLLFETRSGYVTGPSPKIDFTSNGGQYMAVSDIAIGPANVTKRILGFTGANGSNFFYLPTPVVVNGQQIATSTVIPDNTTTSALLDFSDTSLFSGIPIDVTGNNLFAQVVLGPCVNVQYYASRLFWSGEINKVQNFVNMGFDGGYLSGATTVPLGWTVDPGFAGGELVSGAGVSDFGGAWKITGDGVDLTRGVIYQSAFRDTFGNPILVPDGVATRYYVRLWAKRSAGATGTLEVSIYSATKTPDPYYTSANVDVGLLSTSGAFTDVVFLSDVPAAINSDTVLRIAVTDTLANNETVTIDEVELVYNDKPLRDDVFRVSYAVNPEAYDGVTGVLGATSESSAIMSSGVLRDALYFCTQKGLHSTNDNPGYEPSFWVVSQFTNGVGIVSPRGMDIGEDSLILASRSGPRIFDGNGPAKIGQEIQSDWDSINWAYAHTIWVKNDSTNRRVYFGVPMDDATSPSKILVVDYRNMNSADQLAARGSVQVTYNGRMGTSDLSRKWTKWNITAQYAQIMKAQSGDDVFYICGNGYGNVYSLDSSKYTDDDYGQIHSYYTTYFFVPRELAIQLRLGFHRLLFGHLSAYVSGVGNVTFTPLVCSLSNAAASTQAVPMTLLPSHDLERALNVIGERVAFKIQAAPLDPDESEDNFFQLSKLCVSVKPDPNSPVRGLI